MSRCVVHGGTRPPDGLIKSPEKKTGPEARFHLASLEDYGFSGRRLVFLAATVLVILAPVRGSLTVANLHCSFLMSPATAAQLGVNRPVEINQLYGEKFDNLARLIIQSGAEFVGLETIGAKREVEDLAVRLSGLSGNTWRGIFIPKPSRYAGRNLAVVYRSRRGLQIHGAGPIQDLIADVPNHLVFTLTVDEKSYAVCLVDLTNLDGFDSATYALQLQTLRAWAEQQDGTAVLMGVFNDERRKLPPLFSINERLGWPATELGRKGRDYIFATRGLATGAIIAPPFGPDPVEALRLRWTDHFLVKAIIP